MSYYLAQMRSLAAIMTDSRHRPLTTNNSLTNTAIVTNRYDAMLSFINLPSQMLQTYDRLKHRETQDFPSVQTLLDHLEHLHRSLYNCYKWIELVYGAPNHRFLPTNRLDRENPIRDQAHIPLRADAPAHWAGILLDLYSAQLDVEDLMDELYGALSNYENNIHLLYVAFNNKHREKVVELGSRTRVDARLGAEVADSFEELQLHIDDNPHLEPVWKKNFLGDLRTFWRKWGGRDDYKPLEAVWEWVAGQPLRLE